MTESTVWNRNTNTMKRETMIFCLLFTACRLIASVPDTVMKAIYNEVKTPFKYGLVVAPADNSHKIDCPMVFNEDGKWFMTYVVYNGSDGLNGRGYETWLATSTDLLHWTTLGRVLSYQSKGWDRNQRAGYPALIDWAWDGSYSMKQYKGKHWMSYFGGAGTGYEAVREPLSIGMASTDGDVTKAHEWQTQPRPVLSYNDKKAQWWETLTQYKSTVYYDSLRTLGSPLVMFYNAGGVNPQNNLKAERIGIALSSDMRHWHRFGGNPVYSHEQAGMITGDAQIVKMNTAKLGLSTADSTLYVMFYFAAYNPARPYNAYNTFAVSRDLVHWQDWNGPDLIVPGKPYDDMFAHKSYVVKHNGVVYHFYCAVDKGGQRGIAVATSEPMGRSSVAFPPLGNHGPRLTTDLNNGWRARVISSNQPLAYHEDQWHDVAVPHNFDSYYGYRQLRHGNLHGTAEYEKTFTARPKAGKRYFLNFEGIGTYATVTVNGHTFDRRGVGRTTLTLDITPYLKTENRLKITVEHPEMITDMPWVCGGCSSEWGFSEGSQPFGIFRPVTLVETDEVRIEPFGVHVWSNAACDSTFIETEIHNYGTSDAPIQLVSKMNQSDGKTFFRLSVDTLVGAGQSIIIRQSVATSGAHRWDIGDPYLYTLASMIKRDGRTTDATETEFGYRSISWPARRSPSDHHGQFLLNGHPVFINGTCDYEHLFGNSHSWSHEQIASRVKMMRNAGFNAFREAHQPHNLYYQRLLDEQGMLFWSQFSAHIWYDTPQFRDNFKTFLRQWIKERRNSPSIILWGLQNESVLPKDFAEECTAIIRDLDPTSRDQRMVTTCNGGKGTDWNVVQNWSGTYGGSADNYGQELKHDDQLLNGEYGAWRTLGLRAATAGVDCVASTATVPKYSEDAFASLLHKKATLAYASRDSVCGHFQWIFVSHDNPGRVQPDEALRRIDKVGPFNYKGLLSPWEQPTEGFYMYQRLYGTHSGRDGYRGDTLLRTAADMNPVSTEPAAGYTYIYRVNCGGDEYRDKYGNVWAQDSRLWLHSWAEPFADRHSTDSATTMISPFAASQGRISDNIHGTTDPDLFRYFRWGRDRLTYSFRVGGDSVYRVELYFTEPWLGRDNLVGDDSEGERLFSVAINDSVVVSDLDIWAEAGWAGALKKTFFVRGRNGVIDIRFPEVKAGEAVISAIAIARKGSGGAPAVLPSSPLPADYWRNLDTDTLSRYPKALLPKDSEAFPAVRYKASGPALWTITPGVAREYALRFRYKNTTAAAIAGRLQVADSKGTLVVDRDITFPPTPNKFKTIATTTATQINAGHYKVAVKGAAGVVFDYLEVQ